MAFPATCVAEIRSGATAANANGGVWDTAGTGTDWSKQLAAQYNLTGGTSSGAGSVILHASASTDMPGNGLRLVSGTNATASWYVILSVVAGVSITVDRACTTGVGASIVFNIGGAWSLQNANDSTVLSLLAAGNKVWILNGTYTLTGTLTLSNPANITQEISFEGYAATRGDRPRGATRPLIKGATTIWNTNMSWTSIIITHTAGTMVSASTRGYALYCKFVCSSTSAGAIAFNITNHITMLFCEIVSYRGVAIQSGNSIFAYGCYIHDSDVGIKNTNGSGNYSHAYINCIFEGCVTAAISHSGAQDTSVLMQGNTVYGAENKLGTGLLLVTGGAGIKIFNNIFYGLVTALSCADASGSALGSSFLLDSNNFYNNTTDVTNLTKGPNDIALDPTFTSVTQTKGTNGTTSGSVLTSSGASFPAFTPGVDFLVLVSGSGITAGVYGIVSNTSTTITLDIAPGTNATNDKVFQVTSGHNFGVGANMKAVGPLGAFPGALSTGYQDIGAVQRQAFLPLATDLKLGVVVDTVTGTYSAGGSGGAFTFGGG